MALMSASPMPSRTLTAVASSSAILNACEYDLSAGSSCFRIASAASRRRPALRSHAAGCCPALKCLACRQVHMVNPKTGKVLGADEETDDPFRKPRGCYSQGFRTKHKEQRLVSRALSA